MLPIIAGLGVALSIIEHGSKLIDTATRGIDLIRRLQAEGREPTAEEVALLRQMSDLKYRLIRDA